MTDTKTLQRKLAKLEKGSAMLDRRVANQTKEINRLLKRDARQKAEIAKLSKEAHRLRGLDGVVDARRLVELQEENDSLMRALGESWGKTADMHAKLKARKPEVMREAGLVVT